MKKTIQHRALALLVALAFAMIPSDLSAQLPPTIQADRLLVRAERQITEKDFGAAVATLDRISVLSEQHGIDIPVAFWFRHAVAALGAGLYDRAVESAIRYLQTAGQKGEYYLSVLELLDEAESEKQRREERREQRADDLWQITRSLRTLEQAGTSGHDAKSVRHNDNDYMLWSRLNIAFDNNCRLQIKARYSAFAEYPNEFDERRSTIDVMLNDPRSGLINSSGAR